MVRFIGELFNMVVSFPGDMQVRLLRRRKRLKIRSENLGDSAFTLTREIRRN